MYKEEFMRRAIRLSLANVKKSGGPFGAVIVKNGKIISTGVNKVTEHNDPTAHSEIQAIRSASKKLKTFDLSECEIYSSCEPCPMCLSAIYWSRISRIYYGNSRKDAAKAGFRDDFIYRELGKPLAKRKLKITQHLRDEALMSFEMWNLSDSKTEY
ncbi:MAG: nucleoside deaminase [Ignavibacteria bacterium]|nr:nucleoside deaminase [Ignavibacteria bacterium]